MQHRVLTAILIVSYGANIITKIHAMNTLLIFIDVIDNYNQKVLEEDGEYNEGHFPNDNLYLRNMAMLRNAVLTSGNFDEVKSYLSSHQNSISATSSFDIEDLNTLFEYYDNY